MYRCEQPTIKKVLLFDHVRVWYYEVHNLYQGFAIEWSKFRLVEKKEHQTSYLKNTL